MAAARPYRARDSLRDREFLVDTAVAPVLFVAVNAAAGLVAAAVAAGSLAAAILVWRLVHRSRLTNALLGLGGVAVGLSLALVTGGAEGYFWPRVFTNGAWALGFLVTIAVRRPAISIFVRALYGFSWSWLNHDRVRPAYTELTLVWVAFFAGKAALNAVLILAGRTELLAGVGLILGWPAFIALLWLGYRYVYWRLAQLGAPEPWHAEVAGETAPRALA